MPLYTIVQIEPVALEEPVKTTGFLLHLCATIRGMEYVFIVPTLKHFTIGERIELECHRAH